MGRSVNGEIGITNKRTVDGAAKALRNPNGSTLAKTTAASTPAQRLNSK
jgi:hypothetical protein